MPSAPATQATWGPEPNPDAWIGAIESPAAALRAALDLCRLSPLPMLLCSADHPQPLGNPAWARLSDAPHWGAPLWLMLAPEVQALLQQGGASAREVVLGGSADALAALGAPGVFCLHRLSGDGPDPAGVLIIGPRIDNAPPLSWRERMNYAAVIHSMDLGFCLVELIEPDGSALADYRYIDVNPAYQAHTGLDGLVGKRISEVVASREPFWPQAFEEVLRSGQMMHTTVSLSSVGRVVETWIIRTGGPSSRQVAVLVKDVTENHHWAERLRASEERARALADSARADHHRLAVVLEATPAAVVVVDPMYQITLANSRARQLWGGMNFAGSSAWRGRWADGSERQGQAVAPSEWPLSRALRGHSASEVIEITSLDDGRCYGTFLTSAAPLYDADGVINGAVVVGVDIGDRVAAERALENTSRRKDQFLAMLAHELRNPLAPIAVAAELMARPQTPPRVLRESSAIVARQVRHMRGLIDDLLDTARLERGAIALHRQCLDLRPLLSHAIEQNADQIQSAGHELQVHVPDQVLPVDGDAKRIVQILANLLNNAIKYTPNGGAIAIEAQAQAGWAHIAVIDNGIGMDKPILERAFELFAQADQGIDRQNGGLGIGLALVKKLVELHGGTVSARSDGPGLGSRFTVRLPLCAPEALAQPAPGQTQPAPAQAARRVLIVDDNVDAAQTLALFLKACGHECAVAHTGEQALAMAAQARPEVFVLDIGLPGMDGKQLAQALRADPATAPATLLALSGYAQAQDKQAALTAGFDHYLVKPVDVDQLLLLLQTSVRAGA